MAGVFAGLSLIPYFQIWPLSATATEAAQVAITTTTADEALLFETSTATRALAAPNPTRSVPSRSHPCWRPRLKSLRRRRNDADEAPCSLLDSLICCCFNSSTACGLVDSYQLMNEIVVSISLCRIGITGVVPRVKVLLKDHQELIVDFNTTFLPAGYRIPDSAPLSPKSKLMDAWRFVTKIERELLHETGHYYSFLKIMKELREKTKTMAEMCILFQDKPDLLDEFCSYLPDA
ncbi:hypothetical protein RJ639_015611 [Escallonia herrerae]|uniref:Uncharacterized protein n=1 Tax=Escallonia herrerae TaxID=1293975 RepID=A0AA88VDP6_9ASTE|nr:hypothetical protein RJ639_015611 [Escallonia herrerae]